MLLFLLLNFSAFATTFGPISATGQIKNGQYIVHGKVAGAAWVAEERDSRRPFTHWRLQVIAQPKGENLGENVTMRQPGGEIGEFGYHVAGSAQFRQGEEVFVVLRDTTEADVKEVVGLASGKYTVEKAEDGQQVLRNGLGYVLLNEKGIRYSPETYSELVKRTVQGDETTGDRSVFINKQMAHEPNPVLEARTEEARKAKNAPPPPAPPVISQQSSSPVVEEIPPPTEEPESSSWWIYAILAAIGLAGAVYALRR